MSSTTQLRTENESACAGGNGARRALAALLACLAGAGLAIAAIPGSAPHNHPSALAASTRTRVVAAPMVVVPTRTHAVRPTKAKIGLFTATPARLSAGGGSVRLVAIVQDAATCRFSLLQRRVALSTKSCASGTASVTVKVPKNTSGSPRSFRFELKAMGAHSSTSAGPVTVIEGAPRPASSTPSVTAQPGSETVAAGGSASFTAAAHGTPAPTVRWQVSTDGGGTWSNISGATSTTYSFTATVAESGYEYRAVFTNAVGSARTSAATLTVSGSTSTVGSGSASSLPSASTAPGSPLSPSGPATGGSGGNGTGGNGSGDNSGSAPQITLDPSDQSVVSGATATFTAAASGAASVQWEFYSNSAGAWQAVSGGTSATLTFVASLSQSGEEFRAVFTNTVGSATTTTATLTVEQSGAAPAITRDPQNASVLADATVTFTAAATGTPTPTVQWQQSIDDGVVWTNINGATSTTLSFTADINDSGYEYQAVFTNSLGTATTTSAMLNVSDTSPVITQEPSSETVTANSEVTFTAAASGVPTPSVQWEVSMDGGSTWSDASGGNGGNVATFQFTATNAENGFQYRAIFTNSVGSATTSAATLLVGNALSQSDNWSGYAVSGSGFTTVTGSWTVPTVNCSGDGGSYAAEWIGIDGDTSSSVEQDGTDSDCSTGAPNYYAWYEMYGDSAVHDGNSVELSGKVDAGDSMSAEVSVSGDTWTLEISDNSQGWSQSIPVTWSGAARSSAEWIVERPQVNGSLSTLTNFGSVTFGGATANGDPISSFGNVSAIAMYDESALLAAPGSLGSDGESFTDTWYASS